MPEPQWRTAYASVEGSSHKKTRIPCQDASFCRVIQLFDGSEVLLAVASDGAGTATHSAMGAQLVIEDFISEFVTLLRTESSIDVVNRERVLHWLRKLHGWGIKRAEEAGCHVRELACTLLGAIIGVDKAVFFQIGDGAITYLSEGDEKMYPVFWPQHGEFANQTYFLFHSHIEDALEFIVEPLRISKVALFTDGMERLILNFRLREVHEPALCSIFDWLSRREEPQETTWGPTPELIAYLSSDGVRMRTDDDTTLILATRGQTVKVVDV
jgi:hypothetical protein